MITIHQSSVRQLKTAQRANAYRGRRALGQCPFEPAREPAPHPSKSRHRSWEVLVIWGFVVVSFAALFFCGFILWIKCRGDWPL